MPQALDDAAGMAWRLLVVAGAVALVGFVAWRLRHVVVPVVVALFLTSVLAPAAGWLRARRWPPLPATWAVLLAAGGLVTVLTLTVMPQVTSHVGQLVAQLRAAIHELQRWLIDGPLHVSPEQLDRYLGSIGDRIGANASAVAAQVLNGASFALELVAGLLLAFVLTFFFLKDGDRICSWALGLVPETRRDLARRMGRRAFATLGSYVRGSALLGLVEGITIGVGLSIIGVPLAAPLGVLAFLGAFFPLVGSLASGAIAALVALVNAGPVDALLVVGLVVAVNQADAHILQPLVMGKALSLHPVAIILALAAGAVGAGLPGAFLAVPLTAVAAATVHEVRMSRTATAEGG